MCYFPFFFDDFGFFEAEALFLEAFGLAGAFLAFALALAFASTLAGFFVAFGAAEAVLFEAFAALFFAPPPSPRPTPRRRRASRPALPPR
jgi:hypothetical protein